MVGINKGRSVDDLRLSLYTAMTGPNGISINPMGFARIAADNDIDSIDRRQSAQLARLANLGSKRSTTNAALPSVDFAFQFGSPTTRGLIGKETLESVYGTGDEFRKAYKVFEDKFFKELESSVGKSAVTRARAAGQIDLSLLPKSVSKPLMDDYMQNVLRFTGGGAGAPSLIDVAGLPSQFIPSTNEFSEGVARYVIDQRGGDVAAGPRAYHPAQVILNTTNFNYKKGKGALESVTIGSKMPTLSSLDAVMKDIGGGFRGTDSLERSLVFDVETTGISQRSVVRSIAVSEMIIDPDGSTRVNNLMNVAFDSPEMADLRDLGVGSVRDRTLLRGMGIEDGTLEILDVGPQGRNVVNKLTEALNLMNDPKYGRIVAHNAPFDIDMMLKTMQMQEAYDPAQGPARDAVQAFVDRVEREPGFRADTLLSSRIYQLDQANQVLERTLQGNATLDEINKRYVEALFARDQLPLLGRKNVGFAGVENLAMSTNLFELMEKETGGREVLENLYRGTHIADTDVILQGYIESYMKQDKLAIWPLTQMAKTKYGNRLRDIVARSTAVTATTNVNEVSRLSQTLIDRMLSQTHDEAMKALRGVQIRITGTDAEVESSLRSLGLDKDIGKGLVEVDSSGEIRFTAINKEIGNNLRQESEVIDQEKGRRFIQDTLEASQRDIPIDKNLARRSIRSLGVTVSVNQAIDDMAFALEAGKNRFARRTMPMLSLDVLEAGLTAVYRNMGTAENARIAQNAMAQGIEPPPVLSGVRPQYGVSQVEGMSVDLARMGDPLFYVDARNRALSSAVAGLTAQTAGRTIEGMNLGPDDPLGIMRRRTLGATQGLGLVYESAVTDEYTRIFSSVAPELGEITKVPIMSMDVFEQFARQAGVEDVEKKVANNLGKASIVKNEREEFVNIKTMFDDTSIGFAKEDARKIAESMVDTFSDEDSFKGFLTNMGYSTDDIQAGLSSTKYELDDIMRKNPTSKAKAVFELRKNFQNMQLMMGQSGKDAAVFRQQLGDLMSEVGVVTSRLEGKDIVSSFEKILQDAGITTTNDIEMPTFARLMGGTEASGYVSAIVDIEALDKGGKLDELEKSMREAKNSYARIDRSLRQEGAGKVIRNISQEAGFTMRARSTDALNNLINKGQKILNAAPGGPRGVLAAVGLAGVALLGYNATKPTPYDETVDMQPYEGTNYTRADNDSLAYLGPVPSSRRDPLYTAGVVGNLDRNKINHTRMGNGKYDHLF